MTTFYLDYENGNDSNDGSTWALAWKTITSGATAARIAPGDTIRIAKSPAPTSLGCTAVWTDESRTVTLTTAQTLTIDLCESAWTGAGDTTASTSTTNKQGTNAALLTLDASPQASILQAYKATGTLNLSGYQKISFWIRNSAAVAVNSWKICLCSDTAGATPVDTFLIPAIPSTAMYLPLTLARVGGGNLGASIQSIALYTDTAAPTASSNLLLDDFIACTTSGLNLQSIISKNSAEQGGTEGWYGIKNIDGVTVNLDATTNDNATTGEGYSGTTETVTTYKRETIKTALASATSTVVQEVQDNGTDGNNILFHGGYDTGTSNQTGETFFDGLNGSGFGFQLSSKSYITVNYLNVCRYNRGICLVTSSNNTFTTVTNANNNTNYGIYLGTSSNNNTFTTISNANNNSTGIYISSSNNNTFTTISNANDNTNSGIYFTSSSNNNVFTTITNANNNTYYGIYLYTSSSNNTFTTVTNANNNSYGIFIYSSNTFIKSLSTTGNSTAGIYNTGMSYIWNAAIAESLEVSSVPYGNSYLFSHNHDNTAGNHWIFTDGGTINAQATTRHTASGIAWTLTPASTRISTYLLYFKVAKIACAANALVTVKIWMIKGHATNVAGKLVCRGGQLAGVPSDVTATKADDTSWEELTITFTPTEAGVIEIEVWAYYVAGASTVTVDDMTISQA